MARESKKDEEGKDDVALLSGERIRACREARGWTQQELSKHTGYVVDEARVGTSSPSSIGMYEQGRRRVGYEEAMTFVRLFPEWPHPAYFMGIVSEREARVIIAMGKAEGAHPKPPALKEQRPPGKEVPIRRTGTRSIRS